MNDLIERIKLLASVEGDADDEILQLHIENSINAIFVYLNNPNLLIEDIIEKYYVLKSARAVAKEIGCDHSTIDNILNANGVKRFTPA